MGFILAKLSVGVWKIVVSTVKLAKTGGKINELETCSNSTLKINEAIRQRIRLYLELKRVNNRWKHNQFHKRVTTSLLSFYLTDTGYIVFEFTARTKRNKQYQ